MTLLLLKFVIYNFNRVQTTKHEAEVLVQKCWTAPNWKYIEHHEDIHQVRVILFIYTTCKLPRLFKIAHYKHLTCSWFAVANKFYSERTTWRSRNAEPRERERKREIQSLIARTRSIWLINTVKNTRKFS